MHKLVDTMANKYGTWGISGVVMFIGKHLRKFFEESEPAYISIYLEAGNGAISLQHISLIL